MKDQRFISDFVHNVYDVEIGRQSSSISITPQRMREIISALKHNCAPGYDGITSEHIYHGSKTALCDLLSNLYTNILRFHIVPQVFNIGLIVPVIKNTSVNPNTPGSYRPITLISTFAKNN